MHRHLFAAVCGLRVTGNNGVGKFPTVTWSETGHTSANVPIYAWGAGASMIGGVMDNTDIFRVASVPEPATWVLFVLAGAAVLCRVTRRKRGQVQ